MRDSKTLVLGALIGGVAGAIGGAAFCLILYGLAKGSGLATNDLLPHSFWVVVGSFGIGAFVGAVRFPRPPNDPDPSLGRTLLVWTTSSLLTLGGSLAFGAAGGALGMNWGLAAMAGPDFRGSPSPGAGFAAVIMLVVFVGVGLAVGLGLGLLVNGLLSLKQQLLWVQISLAVVGYGAVLVGLFQMLSVAPTSPTPSPIESVQSTPIRGKAPPKPASSAATDAAKMLTADPAWKPAVTFSDATRTYEGLIYPGARASRSPNLEENEMLVLATADPFAQVASYYRSRLQVKHDLSDRLVGTAPVTDGKTAFVGVTVRDGLTFVSLTCGKAAPP